MIPVKGLFKKQVGQNVGFPYLCSSRSPLSPTIDNCLGLFEPPLLSLTRRKRTEIHSARPQAETSWVEKASAPHDAPRRPRICIVSFTQILRGTIFCGGWEEMGFEIDETNRFSYLSGWSFIFPNQIN